MDEWGFSEITFADLEMFVSFADIVVEPLFTESLLLAVPVGDPLGKRAAVSMRDVRDRRSSPWSPGRAAAPHDQRLRTRGIHAADRDRGQRPFRRRVHGGRRHRRLGGAGGGEQSPAPDEALCLLLDSLFLLDPAASNWPG
jgi:hypothetical protein